MPPLYPLRQPFLRQPDTSFPRNNQTQYPMYNEFLSSIAPMRMNRLRQENMVQADQMDRQRHMDNRPVPTPMMPNPIQPESSGPMNTVMDRTTNGLTPYQIANLSRQNRALDSQIDSREGNLGIADRRMDLAEAGGNRLEQMAKAAGYRADQIQQTADNSMSRQIASGRDAMARVERQAEIQRKLEEFKNVNTVEAARIKGELEKELIGLRGDEAQQTKLAPSFQQPETPSQSRIARNDKAVKFVNQYPQYKEYVTADKDGFVVKPSGDPKIDSFINAAIYGGDVGPIARETDVNLPGGGNVTPPVKADTVTPPASGDKRTRAIAALKAGGKVVNDDTIAKVMARLK